MLPSILVNDVHSALNQTRIAEVVRPHSVEDLGRTVRVVAAAGRSLCTSGARHAMGGQQFLSGHTLLDMRDLRSVIHMDMDHGTITAQAGIDWPTLIDAYLSLQRQRFPDRLPRWGIAQKQSGADHLTLGGALSANAHGRGLNMKPIVGDVESFTLMNVQGELVTCSRPANADLFRAAIGGYGLLGPIVDVTLRLAPRVKLRRVVRVIDIEDAVNAAQRRIDDGYLYGDFQFDVDPASPEFLTKGVFACYQPVPDDTPMPASRRELSQDAWTQLLYLAHVDKRQAFEKYAQHYLSTDGQVYWSDQHQLTVYTDGYHQELDRRLGATCPGSEMIAELFVPPERLVDFLLAAARLLSDARAQVIYGTIRLIRQDDETLLPWARSLYTCVIFNLHVEHTPVGIEHAAGCFRALIDLALQRNGSFFPTYHRFAARAQMLAAFPALPQFLELKRAQDPQNVFSSDWHRWLVKTIED
ncbi:MAG: FAD-binding oxidoreductase [Pyrinomonadaceae bacterium]|nr:FAD-binding oxidoreductase [Phycisphaerales bacterium]